MQSAWDDGRDPFDDEHVLALLDAQPELLESAALWRHSVASVPVAVAPLASSEHQPGSTRRVWPWLAAVAAILITFVAWPASHSDTPPAVATTRAQPRIWQTVLTQRVEHHGSACSVREFHMQATAPQSAQRPHNPRLMSRVVQRTQTSLNE